MFVGKRVGRHKSKSRGLGFEFLERREVLSSVPPTVVDVEVASSQWSSDFIGFLQDHALGENGYSIPVGSASQSCSLTWTGIDKIIIEFSQDVRIDADDLSLSGVNTVAFAFSDFEYHPETRIAVWTLATPIFVDRLQIDLDGDGADPVRNLDDVPLDGHWVNETSTYGSGAGLPGTDFEFTFNVLPADVNNDGTTGYYDYRYVYQSRNTDVDHSRYIFIRDIDGDGEIDSVDWQVPLDLDGLTLPSGVPSGTSNDAPTVLGLDLAQVSAGAQDQAISLLYGFDDSEDGASGLTFSVTGIDNQSLLSNVAIDPVSQELVFDAIPGQTGRTNLTIRATDSGGLFVETTLTIDVGYQNAGPTITGYQAAVGVWTRVISGQLVDYDDNVGDFFVEFHGPEGIKRVSVQENGQFECTYILPQGTLSYVVTMVTSDPHGAQSNYISMDLGLT